MSLRVYVATEKFAEVSSEPMDLLKNAGFEVVHNPFNRKLEPSDYNEQYKGIDFVIAGIEKYDEGFFERHKNIRILSRIGIGLDAIDLEAAKKADVKVLNTPDAPTQSVAELTFAFILSLARGVVLSSNSCTSGDWQPRLGLEISGKTLGLIGFGRIGKRVAKIASGFDMNVLAVDPVWDDAYASRFSVNRAELGQVLRDSDFVSVHVPLSKNTKHLLAMTELTQMKSSAFLINTARGGVVCDESLSQCLSENKIAGAALDVFENEPNLSLFSGVPNWIGSPHIGSNTDRGRLQMEVSAVKNLLEVLNGSK